MRGKLIIAGFAVLGIVLGFMVGFQVSIAEENKDRQPLFLGIHHVGLYSGKQTEALQLAKWYEKNFGFRFTETPTSYFAMLPKAGSLEVMKKGPEVRGHLGIQVSDFEAARKDLDSKGIEIDPSIDVGSALVAYIKGTDPAGYKVHLYYMK
jgi:hypothetical protein